MVKSIATGSSAARWTCTPSTSSWTGSAFSPRVTTWTSCPAAGELAGECLDVPAETADDERRVLPRQHQHAHEVGPYADLVRLTGDEFADHVRRHAARCPALRDRRRAGAARTALSGAVARASAARRTSPFAEGAATPPAARVTEGDTYSLAVPGGVPAHWSRTAWSAPGRRAVAELRLDDRQRARAGPRGERRERRDEGRDHRRDASSPRSAGRSASRARTGARCSSRTRTTSPETRPAGSWSRRPSLFAVGGGLALSGGRELSLRSSRRSREDDEVERLRRCRAVPPARRGSRPRRRTRRRAVATRSSRPARSASCASTNEPCASSSARSRGPACRP